MLTSTLWGLFLSALVSRSPHSVEGMKKFWQLLSTLSLYLGPYAPDRTFSGDTCGNCFELNLVRWAIDEGFGRSYG